MTDERAIEILEGMNMQDEQKQIEEMAKELSPYRFCKITICENCNRKKNSKCTYYSFAKRYTIKGYRKASEVIDEFVERLKQYEESVKIGNKWKAVVRDVDIERIAAEMRQEVEE